MEEEVAITLYRSFLEIRFVAELLVNTYNFNRPNIKLLTDDRGQEGKKYKNPTLNNITDEVNDLVLKSIPGDVLYLHLVGHGKNDKVEEDDGEPYFISSNNFQVPGIKH